jgi:hypothetical protein
MMSRIAAGAGEQPAAGAATRPAGASVGVVIGIREIELGYKRASKPLMTAWAKALGISSLNVWQPEPLKSSRERVA